MSARCGFMPSNARRWSSEVFAKRAIQPRISSLDRLRVRELVAPSSLQRYGRRRASAHEHETLNRRKVRSRLKRLPCRRRRVLNHVGRYIPIAPGQHGKRFGQTHAADLARNDALNAFFRSDRIFGTAAADVENAESGVLLVLHTIQRAGKRTRRFFLTGDDFYRAAGQRSNPLGEVAFVIGAAKRARRDDANVGGMFAQCCRVLANRVERALHRCFFQMAALAKSLTDPRADRSLQHGHRRPLAQIRSQHARGVRADRNESANAQWSPACRDSNSAARRFFCKKCRS